MPISTVSIQNYVQQCYVKWFWTISSLGAPEAIFSPLKRIGLHEEIGKAWHEECSRFCWKVWCWGKNLASKQKQWEQKRITSLKRTTKEKKTTPFFSKPGRVQYKNNELKLNTTCRTSHVLGNISDGPANHSKFQSDIKKSREIWKEV